MATRTITLEMDAYERLRASKRPGESFSEVVRRAVFPDSPPTGAHLLKYIHAGGSGVSEAYLKLAEQAVVHHVPPGDPWS